MARLSKLKYYVFIVHNIVWLLDNLTNKIPLLGNCIEVIPNTKFPSESI